MTEPGGAPSSLRGVWPTVKYTKSSFALSFPVHGRSETPDRRQVCNFKAKGFVQNSD